MLNQLINSKLAKIPTSLQELISTASAQDLQFSASEEKILFLAQKDGDLETNIITPPPSQSTQKQSRDIKQGNYYIYNLKDDTNFLIGSKNDILNLSWLDSSDNIIFTNQQDIKVADYDGTNQQTLFIGSFNPSMVFPMPGGSKITTLISPYSGAPENIYTISIK